MLLLDLLLHEHVVKDSCWRLVSGPNSTCFGSRLINNSDTWKHSGQSAWSAVQGEHHAMLLVLLLVGDILLWQLLHVNLLMASCRRPICVPQQHLLGSKLTHLQKHSGAIQRRPHAMLLLLLLLHGDMPVW